MAAHAYREAALEGYERVEGLLDRAVSRHRRLRRTVERQVAKAVRRVRRRHRRLRPEFRQGLFPDRAAIESALRELVQEVSARELVQRWLPQFLATFSGDTWRQVLEEGGYGPTDDRPALAPTATVAMAPLVEQGRLRRSVEHFCRELGVRVVTTGEQLADLGHERLERIHSLAEAPERVKSYLHAVAEWADTLIVPVTEELGGFGGKVQLFAADAADRVSELPRLACIRFGGSRRELRARLIELGIALTGDPARAEIACERALAFI